MPTSLHEAYVEAFRHRPDLTPRLLRDALGVTVPSHIQARLESGELTELVPTEYRADVVVALTGHDRSGRERPVLAVVVEVQLGRDPVKRWSWPVYIAGLRARLRCPVMLLVVCPDGAVAGWCGKSIDLGHPGLTLCPLVVGPSQIPVVTDPELAGQAPELALLSAVAHVADPDHPDRDRILKALVAGLTSVEKERSDLYSDIVLAALGPVVRRHVEALMGLLANYEYQSETFRRIISQGEAKAMLEVLDARGIPVSDEERMRIMACTDPDQMRVWVRRAVTAQSVEELFA
jgi:hypothetical protein